MTQKEKFYARQIELVEQIRKINTEFTPRCLISEFESLKKLKQSVEFLEIALEQTISDNEIKKFYATEEGQTLKSELEESLEILKCECQENNEFRFNKVKDIVFTVLDRNHWDLYGNPESLTIGLKEVNEERRERGFTLMFAEQFSVYNFKRFSKEGAIEINYGSAGSFDPKNSYRTTYLMGLATFSNSFEMQDELKQELNAWYTSQRELYAKIDAVKNRLKNPLKF